MPGSRAPERPALQLFWVGDVDRTRNGQVSRTLSAFRQKLASEGRSRAELRDDYALTPRQLMYAILVFGGMLCGGV